jgi:Helix-turn-helix domain
VRKMLMLTDREEISRGLAESLEYTEIGLRLGRDPSVISREVARHGGRERYRAAAAHAAACAGRERPKRFAVERSPRLRRSLRTRRIAIRVRFRAVRLDRQRLAVESVAGNAACSGTGQSHCGSPKTITATILFACAGGAS